MARKVLAPTNGTVTVDLIGHLKHVVNSPVMDGWGLWRIAQPYLSGDELEVRVWSPGGAGVVKVFNVSFRRAR
jgi:hypothetical protein